MAARVYALLTEWAKSLNQVEKSFVWSDSLSITALLILMWFFQTTQMMHLVPIKWQNWWENFESPGNLWTVEFAHCCTEFCILFALHQLVTALDSWGLWFSLASRSVFYATSTERRQLLLPINFLPFIHLFLPAYCPLRSAFSVSTAPALILLKTSWALNIFLV